jgi:hypothetical protein
MLRSYTLIDIEMGNVHVRESLEGSKQPPFLSLSLSQTGRCGFLLFFFKFRYQLSSDSSHKFQSDCLKQVQICNSRICEYSPFCNAFHTPTCTVLKSFSVRYRGDISSQSDAILSRLNPVHTFAPIHPLSLQSLRS